MTNNEACYIDADGVGHSIKACPRNKLLSLIDLSGPPISLEETCLCRNRETNVGTYAKKDMICLSNGTVICKEGTHKDKSGTCRISCTASTL